MLVDFIFLIGFSGHQEGLKPAKRRRKYGLHKGAVMSVWSLAGWRL